VSGHYVKRYNSAPARNRAEANYRWLTRLQGPAHLPELRYSGERELRFQHVEGRHALPADLTMLAAHLGDVHGSVHQAELRKAELPKPYCAAGGQVLPSFPAGRLAAVERELSAGHAPGARLTISQARRLITSADGPAAFYKDANPRNFLITPDGTPVTIDFDDLTLAPFGYDLAKLTVTLVMTHGPIPAAAITEALSAYNLAANGHCPNLPPVTWNELMDWAEIHHILTARYADNGRYPFPWDQARPS
jgi:aminoglycoside phosphotransferase (APT) family kinase protein